MYIWRKQVRPEWLRLRSEELNRRFGATLAIEERPRKRQIALQVSCPTARQAHSLVLEFGGKAEKLPRNWLRHFAKRAHRKPLRIGSRLVIQSTPDQKGPARSARTIIIPAESAFGTGEHATTAMCLRLLERHTLKLPPGWSMLDAGTGSGILALAGHRLGAARLLAIDNDPLACTVAKRNARANGARDIEFRTSNVLNLELSEKFDVISANLFSEILIKTLQSWARLLAPRGRLIVSGLLRSQEATLCRAMRRRGFHVCETRRRGKWSALLAHRGENEKI